MSSSSPDTRPTTSASPGATRSKDYLAILRVGYQVLESGPIALIARGSEVVARGNDLARLKLSEEVVRVAWTQVFGSKVT